MTVVAHKGAVVAALAFKKLTWSVLILTSLHWINVAAVGSCNTIYVRATADMLLMSI